MAVSYDSFVERFPELKPAGRDIIVAELAAAKKHVNPDIWGEQADDGIAYLAAHRIAVKDKARFARLVSSGSTLFLTEFERMQKGLISGDRVP